MNYQQSIRQVFAPLGERLYMFKSKMYLYDYAEYISPMEVEDKMTYYFDEDLVFHLGRLVNAFDPQEVVALAKEYEERTYKLLAQLEPRKTKTILSKGEIEIVDLNDEEQAQLLNNWKNELSIYAYELEALQNARIGFTETSEREKIKSENPIHPKDLFEKIGKAKVPLYQKEFEQTMSLSQVALFMHYLTEQAIMPPYGITNYSYLASYFFNVSYKVREDLKPLMSKGGIKNASIADMNKIRDKFASLQKAVQDDIKTLSQVKNE